MYWKNRTHTMRIGCCGIALSFMAVFVFAAEKESVQRNRVRSTQLYVSTNPAGADIKIDGQPRGTSNQLFQVPPGVKKMTIEVELDGHDPQQQEVEIRGGRITWIVLELASRANPFENGSSEGEVKSTDLTGKPTELANDDGKPAGRKSFPRGHASAFESPDGTWYLTSVRLHGSRYGYPAAPKEDFHITLCDEKFKPIADFPFPYKKFKHGSSEWVTLRVKPTVVPKKFVICADFMRNGQKVFISAMMRRVNRSSGNRTKWLVNSRAAIGSCASKSTS
ncbi:MAG: PEGA domain-containing protein [Pirellulales bacterium]|nr:PEGA domain-containing protein [Pirellulales bacterium]